MMTVTWSLLLLLPGLAAAAGTAFRRYVWEWVATWPLAAGSGIYAVLSWFLVNQDVGHIPRALVLTGVTLMFIARGTQLGIEDRRARLTVLARREVRSE